jgi:lactoylglutathione lyase
VVKNIKGFKMHINHIAIWVNNLELMKDFYLKYFNGKSGSKYKNESKKFESYFISFGGNARIELMHSSAHNDKITNEGKLGLAHIAISVGSADEVDKLTERIQNDGLKVTSGPRRTGDGYYESTVYDPEGNIIEITE